MHYADSIHQVNNPLQGYNPLIALANARLDYAGDEILILKGEEQTTQRISIQHLQHPRMHATHTKLLDSTNTVFVSGSSDIAIQSPIQGTHGQDGEGIMAVIRSLINASEDNWKNLCKEFSWLTHYKTDPPEELFPGDAFVNQMFRSLQYRIAAEVQPEFAPKILEIWDKETKSYEPRQSYLLSRLMLATEILKYNQVQLSAKKLMSYLKEIYDIKNTNKEAWKSYFNSMAQLKENNIYESNFFSFLFSFIYARPPIFAPFLIDLIDALDELQPEIRTLLLADFGENSIEAQLLISGVWLAEANLENPNWTRCLEVFDKVIEKTIAWDYPHIAAASAKGKAIIHDEYLNNANTAHEVLQDIISRVGSLPVIEEERALVYFHQEHYKEALNIYERILPKWDPPSEQLGIGPLEEYRRAAICAAYLDDWKKASSFFEDGAKKVPIIRKNEIYISMCADAGFAYFKAGNMLNCIKFLHLALQKFEEIPQDNTDVNYFTLKKRIVYILKWMADERHENDLILLEEPFAGFCSNPETNEEILNLPDSPIQDAWLSLAQIEYKFGHETSVLEHTRQIIDQAAYPELSIYLYLLEVQYDFRNKIVEDLPQRIHQMANACDLFQKHSQMEELNPMDRAKLSNFASLETITVIFVSGLLTQLQANRDMHEILAIWRKNSSELPIKDSIFTALDLIDSMLSGDHNYALTVMKTQDAMGEERLVAALKIILNNKTSPENLFYAHTFITTSLIDQTWLDPILTDLAGLLSSQWLEKIKFRAALKTPMLTVPKIEHACYSSATGKKKIGQILLAALQAVSPGGPSELFQKFHSWIESELIQKQEPTAGRNPAAQRLIKAMEKPPHLTDEDVEALQQSIEEGKIPIKFDSPFDSDESENNE